MRIFYRWAALLAVVLISISFTTPVFAAVTTAEETGVEAAPSDAGWDTSIWQQWDSETTSDDNTVSIPPQESDSEEQITESREEQQTVPEQLSKEEEEKKRKEEEKKKKEEEEKRKAEELRKQQEAQKSQASAAPQELPAEEVLVTAPAVQEFAPPRSQNPVIGRGVLVALLLVAAIVIAVSLLRHPAQAENTPDDTE